jgi:hypothetical protein
MPQYMLLIYEPEVDQTEQAGREATTPMMLELHRGLREAGVLVDVRRLRSSETATSVRVREGETEMTDGPFAVTKEVLAGYYVLDCADLDEALGHAANLPVSSWGTVEVRPVMPVDDWARRVRRAGVELSDEDLGHLQ